MSSNTLSLVIKGQNAVNSLRNRLFMKHICLHQHVERSFQCHIINNLSKLEGIVLNIALFRSTLHEIPKNKNTCYRTRSITTHLVFLINAKTLTTNKRPRKTANPLETSKTRSKTVYLVTDRKLLRDRQLLAMRSGTSCYDAQSAATYYQPFETEMEEEAWA